jgi:hypothetical protein
MSTIAVTSEQPPQPISIDQKKLEDVLARPLTIGQSPQGLLVSSQRYQLQVIAGANKINVRDLSGRLAFSQSKVPTVLDFFIRESGFQVNSYGVNFIITVPCAEPAQWIRDNILAPQISEKIRKTLVGGMAIISIASEHKTWNVKLEPGGDETISVDFNASEFTTRLPDQDMLCKELNEQFDGLLQLLNDLGL